MEEVRATIKGSLELDNLERAQLLYTMRLFKEAVEKAHHLIKEGKEQREIVTVRGSARIASGKGTE
jgi:predicted transposase